MHTVTWNFPVYHLPVRCISCHLKAVSNDVKVCVVLNEEDHPHLHPVFACIVFLTMVLFRSRQRQIFTQRKLINNEFSA